MASLYAWSAHEVGPSVKTLCPSLHTAPEPDLGCGISGKQEACDLGSPMPVITGEYKGHAPEAPVPLKTLISCRMSSSLQFHALIVPPKLIFLELQELAD